MIYKEEEVISLLKKHSENTEQWVRDARAKSTTFKALVNGVGFHKELIQKIEHLESNERALVRKKYSKDIRDLFSRVFKKRQNVFDANGGSENTGIKNNNINQSFNDRVSKFKANKSLFNYLSETYFKLQDVDPNGGIMLEYKKINDTFDLYPSYKSIFDIRYYQSNGQMVDFIIFEPKVIGDGLFNMWRFVDSLNDYYVIEIGGNFIIDKNKSFNHPFGSVPFQILSEECVIGSEVRVNSVDEISELAKDYARDKSILTIYKFQKGAPIHYRYGNMKCSSCSGLGKQGNEICNTCTGTGKPLKADVSDVYLFPIPKDNQPFLGDKIAGFVSPDLDTWKQYKEDLRDAENIIEDTIWGTDKTHQDKNTNETATGRYIDIQPISNKLNTYSNVIENVYNYFANCILNFVDLSKDKDDYIYHRSLGRHYIIESPDVLTERYGKSKIAGDNNTILDKQLEEIILSKYKNDPITQSKMIKKAQVEPYVHMSISEVNEFYSSEESYKKTAFQKFWLTANTEKTVEQLNKEFSQYMLTNSIEFIKKEQVVEV